MAIIVGRYNRDAILAGIEEENILAEDSIILVDSFNEAMQYLSPRMKKGDTVLYENDLPDTFK